VWEEILKSKNMQKTLKQIDQKINLVQLIVIILFLLWGILLMGKSCQDSLAPQNPNFNQNK